MHRELLPELVTLPEVLQAGGWRTAVIGKWHLGGEPTEHGFDVAVGVTRLLAGRGDHFSPYGIEGFRDGPLGEYLAGRLCDEALAFIGRNSEQPFFIYLSQYSVHTPVQSPEGLRQKYNRKHVGRDGTRPAYAAMVEALDNSLGRLLDGLEDRGLSDNTIVIFASDNGGRPGLSDLGNLRGGKSTLYEAGVRTPMAVRWPDRVPAGGVCDQPVILSDLAPTLIEACGLSQPAAARFDGVSLLGTLEHQRELEQRALFWHFPVYIRPDKRGEPFQSKPCGSVRLGRYKLIEWFESNTVNLFDLEADPGEERDLADQNPEMASRLLERMRVWRSRTGAAVPHELNPEFEEGG